MILHGIEYQRPTSLNMRILADHVTYSFLAFMKSIFHFCLGCYCGGYSQNGHSNLSSCSPLCCEYLCQYKKLLLYFATSLQTEMVQFGENLPHEWQKLVYSQYHGCWSTEGWVSANNSFGIFWLYNGWYMYFCTLLRDHGWTIPSSKL